MAQAKAGRLDEAIVSYRQAAKINPRAPDIYENLGSALIQKGKTKEAIEAWKQSLFLKPDQFSVLNNLAWLLAATPDAALRDGAKAVALAEQVNKLSGGGNPMVLRTLAAAYAETRRFGDATAQARRALDLAAAQKDTDLASRLQTEIKLYEADTPLWDTGW
jgi:tetratricopeptide (TPR) repeat protein